MAFYLTISWLWRVSCTFSQGPKHPKTEETQISISSVVTLTFRHRTSWRARVRSPDEPDGFIHLITSYVFYCGLRQPRRSEMTSNWTQRPTSSVSATRSYHMHLSCSWRSLSLFPTSLSLSFSLFSINDGHKFFGIVHLPLSVHTLGQLAYTVNPCNLPNFVHISTKLVRPHSSSYIMLNPLPSIYLPLPSWGCGPVVKSFAS